MTQFIADSPVVCVSCGADTPRLLFKKACAEQNIELLKCPNCSMVFLKPPVKNKTVVLYDYYAKRMHLDRNKLYNQATEVSFKKLLNIFKSNCSCGNRILDVGCGDGHFIDVCLKQGWDAQGIETSQSAVKLCLKFNLPVRPLDFFSLELKPGSFNIITLFEVLEHVHSFERFLTRAEELLTPGGILYLTTPNFASLDSRILKSEWSVIHYEHLNYFTPRTLKEVFSSHTKFSLVSLKTRNISLDALCFFAGGRKKDFPIPEKLYYSTNNPCVNQEQRLRSLALKISFLGFIKNAVNILLNLCDSGSTITLLAKKPK